MTAVGPKNQQKRLKDTPPVSRLREAVSDAAANFRTALSLAIKIPRIASETQVDTTSPWMRGAECPKPILDDDFHEEDRTMSVQTQPFS